MKIDESSLYSCIGVAGAQAGEEIAGKEDLPSSVVWFSFFVVCGLLLSIYDENGNGTTNNGKRKDATRLIHLLAGTKLDAIASVRKKVPFGWLMVSMNSSNRDTNKTNQPPVILYIFELYN